MATMTMRQRMLAYVRGEPQDRVPFVQYDGTAAPTEIIWAMIGRQNMGILRWCYVHSLSAAHCRTEVQTIWHNGMRGERRAIHTPRGTMVEERIFEPNHGGTSWKKHFIETEADYQILLAYLRDVTVGDRFERVRRDDVELGDDGLPHVAVQRTPYQQMWVEWTGLETLTMHMADYPDLVEECFDRLAAIQTQTLDMVCRGIEQGVPIPYIVFPDNITAPVIGRRNFARYTVPVYRLFADRLSQYSVPVFVHMDGHLRPLWDLISSSGVRGLDSMSPPPDNDTSVADALRLWPEIRVGINFPSSVHVTEPENVYRATQQILEQGGRSGRLQIQISENVPAGVWRRSFPQIVRAIGEYSAT